MRPWAALRLALVGTRTDAARVTLTALSAALATLAGLAALTVLAIPTPHGAAGYPRWSEQYSNALLREPGLRGGTAFALLLLTIPVLALAGQCARLGAPARDRRLAAFRLAGATPGQVTWIAVLESGLASLIGAFAGLGVYLGGRELLHRPDHRGQLALPTDVLPPAAAVTAVVLGLPLVAAVATAFLLRRVRTTPFGVVRRTRVRGPRPWPGALIVLGLAMFSVYRPIELWHARRGNEPPEWLLPTLLIAGGLTATVGVVIGTGWISYAVGRLLHRYARRPAVLLAARRLTVDPWAGSRTLAALLAALLFGAGAAGLRAHFEAANALSDRGLGSLAGGDDFYLNTMDLVDLAVSVAIAIAAGGLLVAVVEGITARRRTYAALVAAGVPRGTLGRAVGWQALAPAVPAIVVALTVGLLLARGLFRAPSGGGYKQTICDAGPVCEDPVTQAAHTRTEWVPEVTVSPAVPLEQLAALGGGAVAAVLVTVAAGVLVLHTSTAVEELRTA
ncbi:ABC transporter permease [Micromonospora sp. WMMA1363]|uniref:FtsX-like permease family protein n=1 Tax=Micromonospora sp. WMMA1363 TaxID=3053985 RepID=UPI00259C8E70|nr:ABC transporter permease [Micromonospora sp. WMMA1363]MDM4722025.1 ABC transporter permease [Micromonospora sp. WMMA1363]